MRGWRRWDNCTARTRKARVMSAEWLLPCEGGLWVSENYGQVGVQRTNNYVAARARPQVELLQLRRRGGWPCRIRSAVGRSSRTWTTCRRAASMERCSSKLSVCGTRDRLVARLGAVVGWRTGRSGASGDASRLSERRHGSSHLVAVRIGPSAADRCWPVRVLCVPKP